MSEFFNPRQLMTNIWLSLPIKSTVRFRCVSKLWCTSLSDPQFIYKNITSFHTENENEHNHLLVLDWARRYYSVVPHETFVASPLQVSPLREIPSPDEWEDTYPREIDLLTSSCDDLVCFHYDNGEVIGVWNLTTGETKILPLVSSSLRDFDFVATGFGFDDKIQDYKIVQIGTHHAEYEVYVYSLRSGNDCWRKLYKPNFPKGHLRETAIGYCRSYRDVIFYWYDVTDVLVSFDMSSEVFNTISIPQPPPPFNSIQRFCKLKDGSVLMIGVSIDNANNMEYHLWALLGESPSLTKLFRIDWYCGKELEPLGFWKNELVFYRHSKDDLRLLIGDPSSKREPKVILYDHPSYSIESCLVIIKSRGVCVIRDDMEDRRVRRRHRQVLQGAGSYPSVRPPTIKSVGSVYEGIRGY